MPRVAPATRHPPPATRSKFAEVRRTSVVGFGRPSPVIPTRIMIHYPLSAWAGKKTVVALGNNWVTLGNTRVWQHWGRVTSGNGPVSSSLGRMGGERPADGILYFSITFEVSLRGKSRHQSTNGTFFVVVRLLSIRSLTKRHKGLAALRGLSYCGQPTVSCKY